jgi:hypothetical protein
MDVVGTRSQVGGKSGLVHDGDACLGEGIISIDQGQIDVVVVSISYRWSIQAYIVSGR